MDGILVFIKVRTSTAGMYDNNSTAASSLVPGKDLLCEAEYL